MALSIAIDGPVGAGKSSIAKGLARRLGILYLDTGAMYRALGLKAVREGMDLGNKTQTAGLVARTDIRVALREGTQQTFLDGEDVSGLIRTADISNAASAISQHEAVRKAMVSRQRQIAAQSDIILDGRDIGTRVLPDATFKFFLTASPQTRAERRHLENIARGIPSTYEAVLEDLVQRDKRDSERAIDPLRMAEDAREIDTTSLGEEDVLALLMQIIREENT